jgi:Restriction endonuclease
MTRARPGRPTGDDSRPDWLNLELLTAAIYEELSPESRVAHNDHIAGADSGRARQIDVSIRTTVAGHTFLTIIDAKDHGRAATVPDIDAFASLVSDVRANKGILICRGGFSASARQYALGKGLDLCQVHDATSRRWRLDVRVPVVWTELLPTSRYEGLFALRPGDQGSKDPRDWVIRRQDGSRVDIEGIFESRWNGEGASRDVGPVHAVDHGEAGPLTVDVIGAGGGRAMRRVHRLDITYTVRSRSHLGYLEPEECRGILHADGRFVASYLPTDDVPLALDPEWPVVDPSELSIQPGTSILVSTTYQVAPGSAGLGNVGFGPADPDGASRT